MDTAPHAILEALKRAVAAQTKGHHHVAQVILTDLIAQLEREVPPKHQKGA